MRLYQYNANLLGIAVITEEYREIVLCTGFHRDAVVAVILDTVATPPLKVVELSGTLSMQLHVGRIIGMDASVLAHLNQTERVTGAYYLPGRSCAPSVLLGRRELERAVLDQFGIEATVSTVVDVLEENTN